MTAISVQDVLYKPSGVKVEILSEHDEGEYKMVRSTTTGKVFFAHKGQIEIVEGSINGATPERLTQVLKGVGIKTAVEIKELQQSMPGERFTKLEQLKAITRVDWDEVLAAGVVYVE